MGKPVKLMWHRADDARVGRGAPDGAPPGSGRRTPAGEVLAFKQRHTSVETDFRHGLGEILTADGRRPARRARQPRLRRRRSSRSPRRCPTTSARSPRCSSRPTTASTPGQHAQHLLARRPRRQRARRRPAGRERWARTPTSSAGRSCSNERVRARPRQGRRGRRLGQADAGRHRPGHRDPQGVQGRHAPAWSRSTAGPQTVEREIRDAVTGPRVTRVTFADRRRPGRSTRAASRPRCRAASTTASRWR